MQGAPILLSIVPIIATGPQPRAIASDPSSQGAPNGSESGGVATNVQTAPMPMPHHNLAVAPHCSSTSGSGRHQPKSLAIRPLLGGFGGICAAADFITSATVV